MKKITLAFFIVFTFALHVNAQNSCTQTFTVSGSDSTPTVLTINIADVDCHGGNTPTSMQLTNAAGNLASGFCTNNGTGLYGFNLSIDGATAVNGCDDEFNGTDITGFTSLTITSQDDDAITDNITITIDVEVTYSTSVCLNPTGLTASSITDSSAEFSWTAGGSESKWEIAVFPSPSSQPASGFSITTTSGNDSGLTPETDYDLWVRSDCGGGEFSVWQKIIFTTESATLGITNLTFKDFKYFPNPVEGTLSLIAQHNIQAVSVYNMLGQEVMRSLPNVLEDEVDMSSLQTGAYFLKVRINDVEGNFRIIKE